MTKSILNKDPKLSKTKKKKREKCHCLASLLNKHKNYTESTIPLFATKNKQLLDEVFVISRIIKFEVGVVS